MNHIEIADLAGVNLADLDWLLRGQASANVADRLRLTIGDIEDFVKGSASAAMTSRLGLSTISAAEELARVAGRDGAVGFTIGLLISN